MEEIRRRQSSYKLGIKDDVRVGDIKEWIERNPAFTAALASESVKSKRAAEMEPITKELKLATDFLEDIKKSLSDNFKVIANSIVGRAMPRQGVIAPEDQPSVLDAVHRTKQLKTWKQAVTNDIFQTVVGIKDQFFTRRGWSDMIFGEAQQGGWRAAGREYKDELEQYRKDRWMLQKEDLMKEYGSKHKANKAIDEEFANRQRLSRDIMRTEAEIKRLHSQGVSPDLINSQQAGGLVDRLERLLVKFANNDPLRTKPLVVYPDPNQAVAPKPIPNQPATPGFNANNTVHPMYMENTKELLKTIRGENNNDKRVGTMFVTPDGVASRLNPGESPEERDLESDQRHKQDQQVQEQQVSLLQEIVDAIKMRAKSDEDKSDSKESGGSLLDDVLTAVKAIGPSIAAIIPKLIGGAGSLLSKAAPFAVPALGVAAAGVAGYGVGKGINYVWEKATGNTLGNSIYNVFGETEAEKNITKPVSQAEIDAYRAKKNAGKQTSVPAVTPSVPNLRTVGPMTASKLEASRTSKEAIREEKEKKQTSNLINAPTTITNIHSSGGQSGPMPSARNSESSVTKYIQSRYTTK